MSVGPGTGVYWKPVWHILSEAGDFELVLANAQHVKAVPGRKRDVSDAVWLADLQAHGLIRGSFVPPQEVVELRSLMRTRKQLVRERTSHIQRIQKTLEEANIKLDSVISDVLGQSGRAMLEAIVAGERDPKRLAALAHARIQASPETLAKALHGRPSEVHRLLLRVHLDQIDRLDQSITVIDRGVETHLGSFRAATGTCYEEHRVEQRQASREQQANRLLRRLARLGFAAEIKPVPSPRWIG